MTCELAVFAIPKARKNTVGSWRAVADDVCRHSGFAGNINSGVDAGTNAGSATSSSAGAKIDAGSTIFSSASGNFATLRELEVRVCAAPEKGKATKAIIKVLAAFFNVAPRDVVLISGQTSRHKRFEIAVNEDYFKKCLAKIEV